MFIFILISSSNTTNILMMELPQNSTGTQNQLPQSTNYGNATTLNYKSINYNTLKYTKTSAGLLHLCDFVATFFASVQQLLQFLLQLLFIVWTIVVYLKRFAQSAGPGSGIMLFYEVLCSAVSRFQNSASFLTHFYVRGVSFGVTFAISSSFWELFGCTFCIKKSIGAPKLPQEAPRGKMQI